MSEAETIAHLGIHLLKLGLTGLFLAMWVAMAITFYRGVKSLNQSEEDE